MKFDTLYMPLVGTVRPHHSIACSGNDNGSSTVFACCSFVLVLSLHGYW